MIKTERENKWRKRNLQRIAIHLFATYQLSKETHILFSIIEEAFDPILASLDLIIIIMCNNHTLQFLSSEIVCAHGYCLDSECICSSGYSYDLTTYRQRDCRLPSQFLPIAGAIYIVCGLLTLSYSLYHLQSSKKLARKIILAAICLEIVCISFEIVHYASNHMLTGVGFFINSLQVGFASLLSSLSIVSLAGPLCMMAFISPDGIQHELTVSFIFFRIAHLVNTTIAVVYYENPNDPSNDAGWNVCYAIFQLFTSAEVMLMVTGIFYNGFRMIKAIESTSRYDRGEGDPYLLEFLPRVKRTLNMQFYISPLVILIILVSPLMQLIIGYLPESYLFLFLLNNILLVIAFKRTRFAMAKKDLQEQSKSTSSNIITSPTSKSANAIAAIKPS